MQALALKGYERAAPASHESVFITVEVSHVGYVVATEPLRALHRPLYT